MGKKRLFVAMAMVSALICGGVLATEDAKPGEVMWLTDAKAAIALAKREHKVILADFTGSDWCVWCKKLDADVYSTPEFKAFAKEKLVLLTVDFPQAKPQSDAEKKANTELADKFKPEGFPTNVFITPTGEEIGRIGGYEPKVEWMKSAKGILAKSPKL